MIHEALNVLLQSTVVLCVSLLVAQWRFTSAGFRHLIVASLMGGLLVLPWVPEMAPVAVPTLPLLHVDLAWFGETAAPQVAVGIESATDWSMWRVLPVIYFAVVALLALRYLIDALRITSLVRRGDSLHGVVSLSPMVQLRDAHVSPFVWGFVQPRIVVPAGAQRWSQSRMRMVVAHEQAHLDRRDVWVDLLARIVCWFYWWHPLVWLSRRHLLGLAEQACDDAVLAKGISPESYAQELINITRMTRPQVTPAMASTTHLARRVKALLDHSVRRTQMSIYRTLMTVALACVCLLPLSRLSVAADQSDVVALDVEILSHLTEVQVLISEEKLDLANDRLNTLLENGRLTPNAHAQIHNMRGYVAFLKEEYASAIESYEEVVSSPENIPAGLRQTTLYTLAQLHFVEARYPRAIEYMQQWSALAENPGPVPLIFIGQTLYQMEDYEASLDYIEQGLAESEARGQAPKDNWLKLRDFLRVQTGAIPGGADVSRDFLQPARDSELLPIVKVAPVYPAKAKAERVEGYVLVEFTVTRNGAVSEPTVIKAEPPGIFDAAALAAVRKFKYKPRLADGEPVDTSGIRNRIAFKLAGDDAG